MPELSCAEDAARALSQAQVRLGAPLRLVRSSPHQWTAAFDETGGFQVEWSGAWACLVFSAELGFPSVQAERVALNLALSYNALWRRVGNLRMARDGLKGPLMLIGEVGRAEAEPQVLATTLRRFDDLRRWWAQVLANASEDDPEPLPPAGWFAGRA